jgi:hypothetical protein
MVTEGLLSVKLTRRGERLLIGLIWLAALLFGWFSVPLGIWWTSTR